jgi:hypothetical protein
LAITLFFATLPQNGAIRQQLHQQTSLASMIGFSDTVASYPYRSLCMRLFYTLLIYLLSPVVLFLLYRPRHGKPGFSKIPSLAVGKKKWLHTKQNQGVQKKSQKISTHLLTVLTNSAIT